MVLDVVDGRRGAHECHVVKWRDQHASIDAVQVQKVLELGVRTSFGLATTARGRIGKPVLTASAQLIDRPRQGVTIDCGLDAAGEGGGELLHGFECLVGEDLTEYCPHRRETHCVSGQGAPNSANISNVGSPSDAYQHPFSQVLAETVGATRYSATQRLTDRDRVGSQVVTLRTTTGSGGEGVRLVQDQQRSAPVTRVAHPLEETRLGQDNADVGHRRLGQYRRDVPEGELTFEGL